MHLKPLSIDPIIIASKFSESKNVLFRRKIFQNKFHTVTKTVSSRALRTHDWLLQNVFSKFYYRIWLWLA